MGPPFFHNTFNMIIGLQAAIHIGLLIQKVILGSKYHHYLASSSFNNRSWFSVSATRSSCCSALMADTFSTACLTDFCTMGRMGSFG